MAQFQETLREIVRKYSKEGLPCRTDTVLRLAAIDPDSELSLEELSSIILEDIGLTAKVIQTVNSFYYRRVGHEVTSVTQAVVLLGFNTIREIALSMAILDMAEKSGGKALLGLILSSYLGAHLAQDLVGDSDQRERESIMVAGLFHPIARIIIALDSEEAYGALSQMEKAKDPAKKKEVERTLKELGDYISRLWNLPPFIRKNMEGHGRDGGKTALLISGAHALGRAMILESDDPERARQELKTLADHTGLEHAKLMELVGHALRRSVGLSPKFQELLPKSCTETLLKGLEPLEGEAMSPKKAVVQEDRDHLYLSMLTQMSTAIAERRHSVDQVFLLASETILRGIGVDRVLLLLLTKERDQLVPRYGLGPEIKFMKEMLHIPFPPKQPPLKAAFQQNKEILTNWGTLLASNAKSVDSDLSQAPCAISPIIVDTKPIGCFIMDRVMAKSAIDEKDLLRLKAIKDLVVMATLKR